MTTTIRNTQAYGISYSNNTPKYVVRFTSDDEAQTWLNTEEYDFRTRELMSKTAAIREAGRDEVDNAYDYIIGEGLVKGE